MNKLRSTYENADFELNISNTFKVGNRGATIDIPCYFDDKKRISSLKV